MILENYSNFTFKHLNTQHVVYKTGKGPGILLMHELPGMTKECIKLGSLLAKEGFTIYIPLMFGKPGRASKISLIKLCINREFNLFSKNQSSPIVIWMKALGLVIHNECGGPGIGAIGMCLSGNFTLSLMADKHMLVSVTCQPALPMGYTNTSKKSLGVSKEEIHCAKNNSFNNQLLGLRFSNDKFSPKERFNTLKKEFGEKFDSIEIDSSPKNKHDIPQNAHSVLTGDFVNTSGHPTQLALKEVIQFFKKRLI